MHTIIIKHVNCATKIWLKGEYISYMYICKTAAVIPNEKKSRVCGYCHNLAYMVIYIWKTHKLWSDTIANK